MIKIKNWEQFQHFKDRCPPWIKLHRNILEQRDINTISDRSFRVLINLWLLASEDKDKEGKIPEIDDISFRLRMDKKEISKALQELVPFLIKDDDEVISERYQDDVPEERRGEAYREETEAYVRAFDSYNVVAETIGIPKAQKLNKTREGKLKARLKECGGIQGWDEAMAKLSASAFLSGQNNNGWKADLDFILQEKSFTKLMEGSYDNRKGNTNGQSDANLQGLREWVDGR